MADFTYAASVRPYKQRLQEELAQAEKQKDGFAAGTDQLYGGMRKAMEDQAKLQIAATYGDYNGQFDLNAAQQLAGERRLREQMANAGLTDSGYNATNLTALALQRSRADAATRSARQAAKDGILSQLQQQEDRLRQQQGEQILSRSRELEDAAADRAYKLYTADLGEAQKLRQLVESHNSQVYKLIYDAFNNGNAALGRELAGQLWQMDQEGRVSPASFDVTAAGEYAGQLGSLKLAAAAQKTAAEKEGGKEALLGYPAAFKEAVKAAAQLKKDHKHHIALNSLYYAIRNNRVQLTVDQIKAMCSEAGLPYNVLVFCLNNDILPTQFAQQAEG